MSEIRRHRWAAAAAFSGMVIFWFGIVLFLGATRMFYAPAPGVFPNTFLWWEAVPLSRHLFLGKSLQTGVFSGVVYTSYPAALLIASYAVLAPVKHVFGLSYELAQNVVAPLLAGTFTAAVFFWNRGRIKDLSTEPPLRRWSLMGAATGLAAAHAPLWITLLGFNRDNFHIPASLVFCQLVVSEMRGYAGWGFVLALFAPTHVPAWALIGLGGRAKRWARSVVIVGTVAALSFFLPKWLAAAAGYRSTPSHFLFRTGLDGSTLYMTSILQAAWHPSREVDRLWLVWLYPAAALVPAFVLARSPSHRARGFGYFRDAALLVIPYLCTVIMFPQFTSIHPYLTDPLLTCPATALLIRSSLDSEIVRSMEGPVGVAWTLGAAALLMTNLVSLSQ
ncbi:MAG: hypothetical protein JO102_01830, partial [Elusimicrobia bacterium]|nr:hypothetical protein [Elusimicrobiota bacterium]